MFLVKRVRNFFKSFVLFLTGICLVMCTFGCASEPKWVLRLEDEKISEGDYVSFLHEVLINAGEKFSMGRETKPDWSKLKSMSTDAIQDVVMKKARQALLISKEFSKIEQTSEELEKAELSGGINTRLAAMKDSFDIKKLGINEESVRSSMLLNFKTKAVFEENFGEGKSRHIDEQRQKDFVMNNFLKFKFITIPKDANNSQYVDSVDGQTVSKLENVAEVKTPQELVEKYMEEIKNGKSIDDVNSEYVKMLKNKKDEKDEKDEKEKENEEKENEEKETELKFEVVYKQKVPKEISTVDEEVRKFVNEMEEESGPILKENEQNFFILQRFKMTEEDEKTHHSDGAKILEKQERERFLNELEQEYGKEIEVNEKLLKKYSVKKQIAALEKADKRPTKPDMGMGMFPGMFK